MRQLILPITLVELNLLTHLDHSRFSLMPSYHLKPDLCSLATANSVIFSKDRTGIVLRNTYGIKHIYLFGCLSRLVNFLQSSLEIYASNIKEKDSAVDSVV